MPKVEIANLKSEIDVAEGANLRKEALRAKISLYPGVHKYLNCRGNALCGKCAVAVASGKENCSAVGFLERIRLRLSYLNIGREDEIRLACQTRVNGDIEIETTPSLKM